MDDLVLARTVHVIGVVLWIGGVAFVILVLLPGLKRLLPPSERVAMFERLDRGFAWQSGLQVESRGHDIVLSDTLMAASGVREILAGASGAAPKQETTNLRGVEQPTRLWRIQIAPETLSTI
jgi:hypothetical protein